MKLNKTTKTDIMCKNVSKKVQGVTLRQHSISCYASLNSRSFSRSQRIHDGLGMDITLSNGLVIFTSKFAALAKQPKQFLQGIQEAPSDILKTFQSDIGRIKECLLEVSEDIRVNGKYVPSNAIDIAERCFSNSDDAYCHVTKPTYNEFDITLRNRFKYGISIGDKDDTVSFNKAECMADAIKDFANSIDEDALVKELESTLKEVVKVAEDAYTEALMQEKAKRTKSVA